jgi:hypothetical protein
MLGGVTAPVYCTIRAQFFMFINCSLMQQFRSPHPVGALFSDVGVVAPPLRTAAWSRRWSANPRDVSLPGPASSHSLLH